jgi:hypothetical protein
MSRCCYNGDKVQVRAHHSQPGSGLTYPAFEGIMLEECSSDGWDVVEVKNEKGDAISVYSFSVSLAFGHIDRSLEMSDSEKEIIHMFEIEYDQHGYFRICAGAVVGSWALVAQNGVATLVYQDKTYIAFSRFFSGGVSWCVADLVYELTLRNTMRPVSIERSI